MITKFGVTFLTLFFWAIINYFAANAVDKAEKELNVHPWYYVIGSFIFGGVLPLVFLAIKYVVHKFK